MRRHLMFADATLPSLERLQLDATFLIADDERPLRGLTSHVDLRLNTRISRALLTESKAQQDTREVRDIWLFAAEKKCSCTRFFLLFTADGSQVFHTMRNQRLRRVGVHFPPALQEHEGFSTTLSGFLEHADPTLPWDEFYIFAQPEVQKRHLHALETFRRRAETESTL